MACVNFGQDTVMPGFTMGPKMTAGKEDRLIVTFIGNQDGFVDCCLPVRLLGKVTGDYEEELDGEHFQGWFDFVLATQPQGSVVVMGNASYRFRHLETVPTMSTRNPEICLD
ncbi:hypothetical protein HPB48_006529 [Haemaphysalis longicornis]|uniref:Uncharacterized protein n=1 Tax=Haemaphysalis longicornis TaxID=44386 RepID=A0A9J6G857_HAELO|nr:hypothetical protein HPB48_006529 [Haemaphysalis longicornis]